MSAGKNLMLKKRSEPRRRRKLLEVEALGRVELPTNGLGIQQS